MILRSIGIMVVWYTLLGPLLLKAARKFLGRKRNIYTEEVDNTLRLLPMMRYIVYKAWIDSGKLKGLKRFRRFFADTMIKTLATRIDE